MKKFFCNYYVKMLRQLLITLTISIIYSTFLYAQKNYKISLQGVAPDYSGEYVKVGHYYGNRTVLVDSIKVDKDGNITYSNSLHAGIYLIITSLGDSYEFMVVETGELVFNLSKKQNQKGLQISGNYITEAFNRYLNQVRTLEIAIDSLKELSDQAGNYADKLVIQRISKNLKDSVATIIKEYVADYKGTLLSNYLQALLSVQMPVIKIPTHVSNPDSFRWMQSHAYFRKHFFDNINFNDNGLIYTPVLEDKIITYLTRIVEQNPGSITNAIDSLLRTVSDTEVNQYITELLLEKYNLSKHKATEEYVYLHLIKEYYLAGKTPWADNHKIRLLTTDYNRHKPASIHQKAPDIILPDQYNKHYSLSDVQSDYTVVIFWDYECPYCRKALEDIKKVIQNFADYNIHVYTVFTGNDLDVWKAFLSRKIPKSWTNTHLDNDLSIIRSYNISHTPAIFLLSSEKIILSKNLTASELKTYFEKNL